MFYQNEDIIREIKTSTARMRLLKNGIIHYTYLPKAQIDVAEHMENYHALVDLAGDKSWPLIIDAAELINITAEARAKVKELEPVTPTLAKAFVTRSLGHKLLISFFFKINKPTIPNRIFSNYEEAVEWLVKVSQQSPESA